MLLMKVLMIFEGKMEKFDLMVIIVSELTFFKCWGKKEEKRKKYGKHVKRKISDR